VKLLLDENLPPRLADVLQSEFSGSIHVHSCGLGSADDEAIWEYARREGFTIVWDSEPSGVRVRRKAVIGTVLQYPNLENAW